MKYQSESELSEEETELQGRILFLHEDDVMWNGEMYGAMSSFPAFIISQPLVGLVFDCLLNQVPSPPWIISQDPSTMLSILSQHCISGSILFPSEEGCAH